MSGATYGLWWLSPHIAKLVISARAQSRDPLAHAGWLLFIVDDVVSVSEGLFQ
jgi:hypothetical protein